MLPKQNGSSVRIMLDVVSVVLGRNIEELVFLQNNTCKFFSSKSLRGDLQQLYATLLLGNCPCHGFTQVPGKTGGFYHLVCRHGVSMGLIQFSKV